MSNNAVANSAVASDTVTVWIDDREVSCRKGENLIEVAKQAGVEIPHYCYHPHLSIAGNCRMCQIQVEGQPKLTIACNTTAQDGMKVKTHFSSPEVEDAQRATLEFLLINHPLDCTVCDAAGHCKLQDYYYTYDSKASRFIEDKVEKIKAEPLGPEIIYDAERCIMCTRCVRFCDEVTETSELGAFNRGDRGFIGTHPSQELDNPLSGSVADLCPVGALTHRRWRFNTRIWYTKTEKSICTGCSTGCNVNVSTRDGKVVYVKARLNSAVNQEWLCDEGRYGFDRFQPLERLETPVRRLKSAEEQVQSEKMSWDAITEPLRALRAGASGGTGRVGVFLSPFLTLEEMWVAKNFVTEVLGGSREDIFLKLRTRSLTATQARLVSPDYAPNAKGWWLLQEKAPSPAWREELEQHYLAGLQMVREHKFDALLFLGDFVSPQSETDQEDTSQGDTDSAFYEAVRNAKVSVALSPRAPDPALPGIEASCHYVIPTKTVHEKSGVMVSRNMRLQRLSMLLTPPLGALSEWMALQRLAAAWGYPPLAQDERSLFRAMSKDVPILSGVSLATVGEQGVQL